MKEGSGNGAFLSVGALLGERGGRGGAHVLETLENM